MSISRHQWVLRRQFPTHSFFKDAKKKLTLFAIPALHFQMLEEENQPLFFTAKKVREGLECASAEGTAIDFFHLIHFQGLEEKADAFCRISSFNYSVFT
jgi:hypothetical protein